MIVKITPCRQETSLPIEKASRISGTASRITRWAGFRAGEAMNRNQTTSASSTSATAPNAPGSASPATGSHKAHEIEQHALLDEAFAGL